MRKYGKLIALAGTTALLAACGNDDARNEQATSTNVAAPANASEGKAGAGETIGAGLAQSHGQLAAAFKTAGLDATLTGSVPYTLFAPTDEAVGKVSGGLSQDKGALGNILTYHMVPGTVTIADLRRAIDKDGTAEIATVGGANLTFTRSGDAITVKDAKGGTAQVTGAEQVRSNGVVHSVDAVLNPA